jgi:hypothetical protein
MAHRPKAMPDDPIFDFQAMVNAPGFPFKDFKDGKSAEEIFEAPFSRFSNPLLQLLQLNQDSLSLFRSAVAFRVVFSKRRPNPHQHGLAPWVSGWRFARVTRRGSLDNAL